MLLNYPQLADVLKKSDDFYTEWDEWETIHAVKNALEKFHDVILIEADINAYQKFISEKPDIVFNIAEGSLGLSREAQIPAMLDFLNIPYTASDPLTLSLCLNKARTKEILNTYGIPTAKFSLIYSSSDLKNSNLDFPIIVKPVAEGSSKGVFNSSLINSFEQVNGFIDKYVEEYNQPLIAEEFLSGREFTVSLMGNGDEVEVLPIVEINFEALPKEINPIYSYEAKWILDGPEHQLDMYLCPADISSELEHEIKSSCIKTFHALNCRDWSRIDIRLDKNNIPNVIEVNPLPGILPDPKNNSCFPKSARTAGLTYDEMINNVLYFALKRYGMI
ncbi:MAG: hypothetical protein Fur0015_00260 [Ignavibacteriales bacterium]